MKTINQAELMGKRPGLAVNQETTEYLDSMHNELMHKFRKVLQTENNDLLWLTGQLKRKLPAFVNQRSALEQQYDELRALQAQTTPDANQQEAGSSDSAPGFAKRSAGS